MPAEPPKRPPGSAARLAGMGTELAATLAGACLLGYWIDRRFETGPWGLLICATLGVVGGLYNMLRRALGDSTNSTNSKGNRREPSPREDRND